MKKLKAKGNIRVGNRVYKNGEIFEIEKTEAKRLLELGVADFESDEIEELETDEDMEEESSEEGNKIGGMKGSKKGK